MWKVAQQVTKVGRILNSDTAEAESVLMRELVS